MVEFRKTPVQLGFASDYMRSAFDIGGGLLSETLEERDLSRGDAFALLPAETVPPSDPWRSAGIGEGAVDAVASFVPEHLKRDASNLVLCQRTFANPADAWARGADHLVACEDSLFSFPNSMAKRGWTLEQIAEAANGGEQFPAVDMTTGGQPATRYVHPVTGKSVVVNDNSGIVVHVGGEGFMY